MPMPDCLGVCDNVHITCENKIICHVQLYGHDHNGILSLPAIVKWIIEATHNIEVEETLIIRCQRRSYT